MDSVENSTFKLNSNTQRSCRWKIVQSTPETLPLPSIPGKLLLGEVVTAAWEQEWMETRLKSLRRSFHLTPKGYHHLVTGHTHLGAWESSSIQETPEQFRTLTTLPANTPRSREHWMGIKRPRLQSRAATSQGLAPGPLCAAPSVWLRPALQASESTRPNTDSCTSSMTSELYKPPSIKALDRRPFIQPCKIHWWLPMPTTMIWMGDLKTVTLH